MVIRRFAVVTLIGLLSCSSFTAESNKLIQYKIKNVQTYKSKEVTVTWYTSTVEECDSTPFETADGSRVRHGILAVSPDLLKTFAYGDSVYISEMGWFEIRDRMNNRWKNRVDIWTDDRSKAIRNGIQQREIRWGYENENQIFLIK